MGAPTGSAGVVIVTLPVDNAVFASSAYPVIAIVAGDLAEYRLILAHISASGFHVCADACSGVRSGAGPACGSTVPISGGFPSASTRKSFARSAKETSTTHRFAVPSGSCHKTVGGVISGGNTDPLS